MGKNKKNDKNARNKKAVKAIREKQSQKRKRQKQIARMKDIIQKEKQLREKEKQERREARRQARRQEKENARQQQIENCQVKTKEQEREEFIHSIRKAVWYERRVNAEIADQKRKEAYLKHVYDKYEPKLEQKVYRSKQWEGKGDR